MSERLAGRTPKVLLTFVLPSTLGLLLFLAPLPYDGGVSIPIAVLARSIQARGGDYLVPLITGVVVLSALSSLLARALDPAWLRRQPTLDALLNVTPVWLTIRCLGAAFALLCVFDLGPAALRSDATGWLVLGELMPILFSVFLLAGLLLPLLLEFGLLELIGSLMTPLMRPLFRLPGRSAIDCATSWLGDGSVGILLTGKQYEAGYYTRREAAVIGTNFSAVSITFCLVVISQVRLEHRFWEFYLAVCSAGLVAALIVPRLPPLSRVADCLHDGSARGPDHEALPPGRTALGWGVQRALDKAAGIDSLGRVALGGLRNAADMIFGVLPVVMAVGTVSLTIAETTPLFAYLGKPFIPLLEALRIPEAAAASQTLVVGFADMFIPSIMAASIDDELTRFVIATVSVTQLIYMSEVGALLLGSRIPISFAELVAVFFQRTLVTLPVVALAGHCLL